MNPRRPPTPAATGPAGTEDTATAPPAPGTPPGTGRTVPPGGPGPASPDGPGTLPTLRRVTREAVPFLRGRTRALAGLAAWSALEFGQTFLVGHAVARAVDSGFTAGSATTGLLWLAAAALAAVPAALASRGVFARLAELVEPLRDGLVRRAAGQAVGEALTGRSAGVRAVSRVTHQSEIARDGWAGLVLALRSFVFTAAGALAGLAVLSPLLLLVVLPPVVTGLALFLATLAPMARHQRAYLTADEEYAAETGRTAAALRDIAATRTAPAAVARTVPLAQRQAEAATALARWTGVRLLALALAARVPPLLLLLAAPWLLRNGFTAGGLIGAFTYLGYSLAPALASLLSAVGTAGGRLLVVLDRFTGRTVLPPPPGDGAEPAERGVGAEPPREYATGPSSSGGGPRPPAAASSAARPATAELRAVSFAYGPAARPVLDRLDLVLRPGDHLAVVGPSGTGKSTLAAVLCGVLPPTGGELHWLGRPATALDPASVRTLHPQRPYVFTGTLRENLRYLRPTAGEREVARTITAIGLDPLVERLGGPDAPLDPRRLTPGERQLVALGRAHLATAPLLVLDEATSRLDPGTEARAETALAERTDTLVVIAHRLTSAARAGRVLVMDGTRTDQGTGPELLARSALYRDLTGHWHGAP
jgi:ATP-binding cassette, subfamily C, bacterial